MAESDLLRLFVAIRLPAHVQQALAGTIDALRASIDSPAAWVAPRGIHLTLRFLGDVPDSLVPEVTSALEAACREIAPFSLRLEGAGTFLTGRSPSVLWAGIGGAVAELDALQAAVERATAHVGEAPGEREFHPHLTLGRVRRRLPRDEAREVVEALGTIDYASEPAFDVSSADLMRSELIPRATRYTRLASVKLGG